MGDQSFIMQILRFNKEKNNTEFKEKTKKIKKAKKAFDTQRVSQPGLSIRKEEQMHKKRD